MKSYTVNQIKACDLGGVDFSKAEAGSVAEVRVESSDHHPAVNFALLHDTRNLYLRFDVADCYVKVVHSGFHSPVYRDSCVEFFVRPRADRGYFNFEVNAGGALLLSYVEDWRRTATGLKKATSLTDELCRRIEIISSLPHIVDPEITTPTNWDLSLKIPLCVLEAHAGELGSLAGKTWSGNFYKCADGTSHPHWISWSPVEELNFHAPECFGELRFEG
ncbi:MAG: carbohydrate-binding family 9-like protein [Kiritimatiellae bacterium]|nr:carbohydrate-binding family 9-like protein [Kiritimatiellia bacterium]